tara:strand:+ start:281 stop:532 length:252 start_codon:yes stop_codon:yes gene_type:complete
MKNEYFDMQGWLRKQWQKERDLKENIITEEYIENMRDLDDGLTLIKDSWDEWKNGPMTEKSDIKPAQKELTKYMANWIKKNIR